jgi:hypothetical protein
MLDMLLPVRPAESLTRLAVHITQVARYIDGFFGFDQWFLFDTRWAAPPRPGPLAAALEERLA